MKQQLYIITLLLFTSVTCFAQNDKQILLEDIFTERKFSQDWVWGLNSMNDGLHYTIINRKEDNALAIEKFSYKNGEFIEDIITSNYIDSLEFDSYKFSADETKLLLEVESSSIYRYSYESFVYEYNISEDKLTKINENKIRLAEFSPDGTMISYVYQNNLYIYNINTKQTIQCTNNGKINNIINGATDWVYEEEFAIVKGYEWSDDSEYLAYYVFDESKVKEFSMDIFNSNLYPQQSKFKYPKAGEDNSIVEIFIFNLDKKEHIKAKINKSDDDYIPRIKWNKDSKLCVQKLNRHQNHLQLIFINPISGEGELVYEEFDDYYIDIHDNLIFTNNGFLWSSEKDGYNHLYFFEYKKNKMKKITKGEWEITNFYGFDKENNIIYYQSNEESPLTKSIYSINLKGKNKKLLSKSVGVNNADFSKTFKYFINTHSNANSPNYITLQNNEGEVIRVLKDSKKLNNTLMEYNLSSKEFFSFKTDYKVMLNGWIMKPKDFDENKKYPVLMYVYGGPGNQQVLDSWSGHYMWYQLLCQKGYIIVCIDNRGTGGRGSEFKKCTYKELGKLETEDQIAGAKYLSTLKYIDINRIGIWGWSYGGYMSSLCLLKGNEYFNTAIAVAPVTNWRYYDTIYTERYMRTPQENPDGYDLNSPINYVDLLKGNYLLIHGSADDNVHYQNTMEMISALVKNNKQFELFVYPDKNHSIYGGNTRIHLFTKITNFIIQNL